MTSHPSNRDLAIEAIGAKMGWQDDEVDEELIAVFVAKLDRLDKLAKGVYDAQIMLRYLINRDDSVPRVRNIGDGNGAGNRCGSSNGDGLP